MHLAGVWVSNFPSANVRVVFFFMDLLSLLQLIRLNNVSRLWLVLLLWGYWVELGDVPVENGHFKGLRVIASAQSQLLYGLIDRFQFAF